MIQRINTQKADRLEIAPLQEVSSIDFEGQMTNPICSLQVVVKAEAMLTKMGDKAKKEEKMKDMYTKKEVEALLALKMDKTGLLTCYEHIFVSEMSKFLS
jgi:hypothetical protein